MSDSFATEYLANAISTFRAYKKMAEKALAQLDAGEYFLTLDEESNSVAVIMKHISGNSISRWTDFLTSDGEKPDRNRDSEFVIDVGTTKENLHEYWERGWACVFSALEPLQPSDFEKKIRIRGQEHSIIAAINRQLTHYAYHVGQIVFLAKHFRSAQWQTISVPRNRSAEFNAYLVTRPGHEMTIEQQLDEVAEFARSERQGQ
ncbi:MAG TPA: DUF1572 family protein [Pyrinomonadaceae bacterium]|nr:DUF1572 family protein [Pyrinomonadaceae bacterium]